MTEVWPNIIICQIEDAVGKISVHACKSSYKLIESPLHYLYHETEKEFWLNWVDANDSKYFNYNNLGVSVIMKCFDFIEKNMKHSPVYIHCDRGESRSPSLALAFLAKRMKVIPNDTYENAANWLTDKYQKFNPNKGITDFLKMCW